VTENMTPLPALGRLARQSDAAGIFEHSKGECPRPECGYCTDDAGRLLAISTRLASDPEALSLARVALGFLERAHLGGGHFLLRHGSDGTWTDDPPSDDAAGRALLGLGTAAAWAPWPDVRTRALVLFNGASDFRSEYPRATAYAALGATELLLSEPAHVRALHLVSDAADRLPEMAMGHAWPWPERRLSYANALLPEAALAVATATGKQSVASEALQVLWWLVGQEMVEDHFSFAPVGGRDQGGQQPAFDQQPIEAWAMADACARAFAYTGDLRWAEAAGCAGAWFLGDNDANVPVFNPKTGGGFDGLEPHGVNLNEGAESTLAFVGTMFQLQQLPPFDAIAAGHLRQSPHAAMFQAAVAC